MAGAVRVDDRALLGALVAMRRLDTDLRKETARATRTTLAPLWRNVLATRTRVAQRAVTPAQDALAGPGRASFTAGGRGTLVAFTSRRRLSGGLSPDQWWTVEFGTTRPGWAGSRVPRRTPPGRIVYAAVARFAPTAQRVALGVLYDVLRGIPGAQDGG